MPTTRIVHPDHLSATDVAALLTGAVDDITTVATQPGAPAPTGSGTSLLMIRRGASVATDDGTLTTAADALVVTDGTDRPLVFTDPVEGLREYAEILDLVAEDLIATMETSANGADLMTWIRARDDARAEVERRTRGAAAATTQADDAPA